MWRGSRGATSAGRSAAAAAGRMPSWRSRSPSRTSCEKPGIRERCGLRGSGNAIHRTPETPRIVAIPNGVPVPETAWQRRPEWRAAPRAVFVGRLAPEKGLDTLIDAWPSVRATYPEARLILIGEGPERAALEDRVKALGLTLGPGQAVELPGASADPTEALRGADLFVLPSREEGMSIALLEAMALGIPLVASSIPGNRRLVSDFKHGRLAPPDDPRGPRSRHHRSVGRFRPCLPHEPRRAKPRRSGILDPELSPANTWSCSRTSWGSTIGSRSITDRDRAQRLATDPDAGPLGGREADGAAGQGAAARPVPGRGRDPHPAWSIRSRAERGGDSGHGDRQAVQA